MTASQPGVRTHRGTRTRRFQTADNRWGAGATHLLAWLPVDPANVRLRAWLSDDARMAWQFACGRASAHGEEIASDTDPRPVTCRGCRRSGYVPPAWLDDPTLSGVGGTHHRPGQVPPDRVAHTKNEET